MRVTISDEPDEEPVTVAEAKSHLNVTHTSDDTFIDTLVESARRFVEAKIDRKLITQTLIATFDVREFIPPVALPYGPVQSVSTFDVFDDENDEWDTVLTTAYYVAGDKICVAEDTVATAWPTADRVFDSFRVTYTAGYGLAAAVPRDIKQAILLTVADLYRNRETIIGSGLVVTAVPVSAQILLSPYVNYERN